MTTCAVPLAVRALLESKPLGIGREGVVLPAVSFAPALDVEDHLLLRSSERLHSTSCHATRHTTSEKREGSVPGSQIWPCPRQLRRQRRHRRDSAEEASSLRPRRHPRPPHLQTRICGTMPYVRKDTGHWKRHRKEGRETYAAIWSRDFFSQNFSISSLSFFRMV